MTGIRASLELSLAKKPDADSVMDVVSAEDIGKLPDKNIADAVQRVPGVNISSNVILTFDGLNLNNPVLKYYSNPQQPEAFYSNGRQYFLGVRVSL